MIRLIPVGLQNKFMGHHYVPQYYLRGFSPGFGQKLWVYDKQQEQPFSSHVKSVANICKFYSDELESHLAEKVEDPANFVLDKIRKKTEISKNDKVTLAEYIAVLWKRVPEGKVRFINSAPQIAERLQTEINEGIDELVKKESHLFDLGEKRKNEVESVIQRFSENPPDDIWHQVIPAGSTPNMIDALSEMTWRYFVHDEKPVFLTCDNPVFFFSGIGIGKSNSELSFPISSNITLQATRNPEHAEGYFPANKQVVMELNRRTAHNATRFCFHALKEDWVLPFLNKGKRQLKSII
ncbi:MAG: DUF4238 domain-containing protein [Desulfuromonadales bacterium]|nr:DUF4238 domain-containing protein [Desulfuromonadales bacterium]